MYMMNLRIHLLWLGLLFVTLPVNARVFRASPEACYSDSNSISSAFFIKSGIGAGDTLLLPGGVYPGKFQIDLRGEPGRPVVIRSVPGETAILKRTVFLSDFCHDLVLMDIEITGDLTATSRRVAGKKGSNAADVGTEDGIIVGAKPNAGIKLINLVIHDMPGDAMSLWVRGMNTEAYGNILYNNGWDGPDRGHGHGIYTQNDAGLKIIEDNICFKNLGGVGIKVYTETSRIRNYHIEGNVVFGNNMFLLGGLKPVFNLTLKDNYMGEHSNMALGYVPDTSNINLDATGNYLWNTKISRWRNVRFTHNKIFGDFGISYNGMRDFSDYRFDSNAYYVTGKFNCLGVAMDFPSMQQMGFEANGYAMNHNPDTNEVIVRSNKYETGRAHIIVYNWKLSSQIMADLSGVLKEGDEFEIRDVQNLHGKPVVKGIYRKNKISIPMELNETEHKIGDFTGCYHADKVADIHTSSAFGVFLVRKTKRTE